MAFMIFLALHFGFIVHSTKRRRMLDESLQAKQIPTFTTDLSSYAETTDIPANCPFTTDAEQIRILPGVGYHLPKATPLSARDKGMRGASVFVARDPSKFKVKRSTVMKANCPQWAWKYPDSPDWSFHVTDSLYGATVSETIHSARSYKGESKVGLSLSVDSGELLGEGFNAQFTASLDFAASMQDKSSNKNMERRVTQKATAFEITVDSNSAKVADDYWNDLAVGYRSGNFANFIELYGTHIVTDVIAGAMLHRVHKYKMSDYQTISSSDVNFAADLKLGYLDATGEAGEHGSSSDTSQNLAESISEEITWTCRGGYSDCTIDKTDNTVKQFWDNAYKFPAALEVTLLPHFIFVMGLPNVDTGKYDDDRRWEEFQKYISSRYKNWNLKIDRDNFMHYWKTALASFCNKQYIEANGQQGLTCFESSVPLPESSDLLWLSSGQLDFDFEQYNVKSCLGDRHTIIAERAYWSGIKKERNCPFMDCPRWLDYTGTDLCRMEGYEHCTSVMLNKNKKCYRTSHCDEAVRNLVATGSGIGGIALACNQKICSCIGGGDDCSNGFDSDKCGNSCTSYGNNGKSWCYLATGLAAYTCPGAKRGNRWGSEDLYWSEAPCADQNGGLMLGGGNPFLNLIDLNPVSDSWWFVARQFDGPGDDGDDIEPRQFASARNNRDVCNGPEPIGVKCLTKDGRDASETGEVYECNIDEGFKCLGANNNGACLNDYKVAYQCPGTPPQDYEAPVWATSGRRKL